MLSTTAGLRLLSLAEARLYSLLATKIAESRFSWSSGKIGLLLAWLAYLLARSASRSLFNFSSAALDFITSSVYLLSSIAASTAFWIASNASTASVLDLDWEFSRLVIKPSFLSLPPSLRRLTNSSLALMRSLSNWPFSTKSTKFWLVLLLKSPVISPIKSRSSLVGRSALNSPACSPFSSSSVVAVFEFGLSPNSTARIFLIKSWTANEYSLTKVVLAMAIAATVVTKLSPKSPAILPKLVAEGGFNDGLNPRSPELKSFSYLILLPSKLAGLGVVDEALIEPKPVWDLLTCGALIESRFVRKLTCGGAVGLLPL